MLAQMLGYGVLLPFLASGAVLLASWPLVRRVATPGAGAWSVAPALGVGCAAGQVGVEGWRPFPPREVADRLFYLALLAAALSCLRESRSWRVWPRMVVRAALWLAVVWFVLPPELRKEAGRDPLGNWLAGLGAAVWLVGLGAAGGLFWTGLSLAARRSPGATLPLVLVVASAGTAGTLHHGHSVTLARLAGVLTAALLPVLLRAAARPPVVVATTPVMVLLPGLWLRSLFYDYKPPPVTSFLLLAAAALAGGLGLLPGVRKLAPWKRCLLCGLTALLLAAGAVLVARRASTDEPAEYLQINTRTGADGPTY